MCPAFGAALWPLALMVSAYLGSHSSRRAVSA